MVNGMIISQSYYVIHAIWLYVLDYSKKKQYIEQYSNIKSVVKYFVSYAIFNDKSLEISISLINHPITIHLPSIYHPFTIHLPSIYHQWL